MVGMNPSASPMRRLVQRVIKWSADGLYLLTVMSVLALAVRVVTVIAHKIMATHPYPAVLSSLDPILTLLMLAELLHTVVLTFKTRHLPVKPLLALVWIALLRHGVVLATTTSLASANAVVTLVSVVILSVVLVYLPAHDAD
ncbi:MAG: hypothetical protein C7B43_08535 [Sulfobacillus benefaciens]|uniref:Protein PsiE n=1 Tax=Sulfobacillus benefaciens TaxID=453960 RepID=A0A2T2X4L0_9FIRM|nr:MAG: hypothetical protein C7B43_08535 [Sulfobacillus benefaciens]